MPSIQSHLCRFFLNRFNAFGGPRTTLQELRQHSQSGERFMNTPASVMIELVDAGGVPAEWAIPPGAPAKKAVLYFHGGAFVMGSPRMHRPLVAQLALASGIRALSIDYRLAPEYPFPAGLDDCVAAFHWLVQQGFAPHNIVVAGDSAGGNLALALLLKLRDSGEPLPAAAVAISPVTDVEGTRASRRTKAAVDPVLGKGFGNTGIPKSYTSATDLKHPYISPLFADLRGLPPVLIHVGEDEILLDDATEFISAVQAAGGTAQGVVWPHMWHVFQIFAPFLPEANQSLQQIGAFIRRNLS